MSSPQGSMESRMVIADKKAFENHFWTFLLHFSGIRNIPHLVLPLPATGEDRNRETHVSHSRKLKKAQVKNNKTNIQKRIKRHNGLHKI